VKRLRKQDTGAAATDTGHKNTNRGWAHRHQAVPAHDL